MFKCRMKKMSIILCIVLTSSAISNIAKADVKDIGYSKYLNLIQNEGDFTNKIERDEYINEQETLYKESSRKLAEISEIMVDKYYDNQVYSDYDNNYAGEYLNDNGQVVVLSLDQQAVEKKLIKVGDIKIKTAKFNLDYLLKIKQIIDNKIINFEKNNKIISPKNKEILSNFSGLYIDVEKNAVIVELYDLSERSINLFKEVICNDNAILFEKGSMAFDSATELQLGRAIYTKPSETTVSKSSIGYPSMYYDSNGNKVYGFITCAHGKNVGDIVYINSSCLTKIGKVVKRKLSGTVDASFVKITNSNYILSRRVYYKNSDGVTGGVKITGQTWYYTNDGEESNYNPAKGELAWKSGSTSYLTSGKIVSTWATVTTVNGTLTDVYKATVSLSPGDSGGVFFQKDYAGEYSVMGISKATGGGYSYFVRIENIEKELGVYIIGYDIYHNKEIN